VQVVDYETVQRDRSAVANFEPLLKSCRLRRDKFHAHFDKGYFFNRKRISSEAPLKWPDLEGAIEFLKEVLNRYSAAYNGQLSHVTPLNVDDLNYLLDKLRAAKVKNAP
jgi:hypothetical protein